MKELSTEEKAARYDKAIEIAKSNYDAIVQMDNDCTFAKEGIINTFHHMFPELAESEDERIMKEIMDFIDTNTIDSDERRNRWFSYLEKYKPISFTSLEDIKVKVSLMQYISELNQDVVHLHPGIETCNEWIAWLEKQGESIKIKKGKNYLCTKTHKYAGVEWREGIKYYSPEDYSLVNQGCTCYCPKYSKEEHNNFFKEMEYDGCLDEQGEQKPADKVESNKKFTPIESALKDLICDVDNSYTIEQVRRFLFEYGYKDKILNAAQEEMQKPAAWSEENEEHVNSLLKRLEGLCRNEFTTTRFAINEDETWLKSLKDRVQPKQEWSEEDESNLEFVISQLRIITDDKHFAPVIDWLKSLRHRLQWKPSDEQMSALSDINCTGCISYAGQGQELINLYNDLKKLKGE